MVNLPFLGNGCCGNPRDVFMFTDQRKYIFNCGEGFERLASQHKCKILLKKLPSTRYTHQKIIDLIAKMQKEIKHQKMSNQTLANTLTTVPSIVYLQFLGNGCRGNPRGVFMFTDQRKYIFNCGEGFQRLASQHKSKISQLSDIFITSLNWQNIGGLTGLSLTLEHLNSPGITIHGPPGLEKLFQFTRYFGVSNNLKICNKTSANGVHDDPVMRVETLVFNRSYPSENPKRLKTSDDVYAFICKLKDKPGQLLVKKCVELKVPRGPLFSELKAGNDITLEDGTVVKSSDVRGPSEKGPTFFILEIPTLAHLDSFLNYPFNADILSSIELVIHFSPLQVVQDPKYKHFVAKFPFAKHIGLNDSNGNMAFLGAHLLQRKLNLVNPDFFPHLHNKTEHNENGIIECVLSASKFHLRPFENKLQHYDFQKEIEEVDTELLGMYDFQEACKKYREEINVKTKKTKVIENEPEIIFLGTGSSMPSKGRNCSAILLKQKDNIIMMDCGEGSFGQFYRFFGSKTDEMLKKLKLVFISHLHADHQIGLINFLLERDKKYGPLTVICPRSIVEWLSDYNENYQEICHLYEAFVSTEMLEGCDPLFCQKFGLSEIKPVRVAHCRDSCGIIIGLKFKYGSNSEDIYRIAYSGDAMPSDSLINAGYGSNLLIHEATMGDDMQIEARAKRHSTSSQAIEVGKRMSTQWTILTHFSQRYSKLPLLNENFTNNVGVAFDNMQVKLSEMKNLHRMLDLAVILFAQDLEETIKRKERRERNIQRALKIMREKKNLRQLN